LIYRPKTGGYPIVNYEYGIVSTNQESSATATAIRSLLSMGGQPEETGTARSTLSQVNFVPLPTKVVAQSVTQILKIK